MTYANRISKPTGIYRGNMDLATTGLSELREKSAYRVKFVKKNVFLSE